LIVAWCAVAMAGPLVVRTSLAERSPAGVVVVVQTEAAPGGTLTVPDPVVAGADAIVAETPREERIDGDEVITRRYSVRAPTGHYELQALTATWTDGAAEQSATGGGLFFDLGPPPAGVEAIEDIVEPATSTFRWGLIGGVAAAVAAVAAGAAFAFRPPKAAPERVIPLDEATLTAWAAAVADPSVDEMARAVLLARLTRGWLTHALSFPADAWTRPEVVRHIGGLAALPPEVAMRVDRLLSATDLVKYAESAIPADTWTRLGTDLKQVIERTRPATEPS
jgi:hypothetical protein